MGIRGGVMGDVYSLFYGITSFVNVEHHSVVAPSAFTSEFRELSPRIGSRTHCR